MPARRGRPRQGDRRIDAAIDHFAAMGYAARDVSAVVTELLKVYGGTEAWPLLEEASYEVVQNRLFEMEEEEKQKPPLLEQDHHQGQQEQQPPQHQEQAVHEAEAPPESGMSILQVHNEAESADEEVEDPMFIAPPALEALAPPRAAIVTRHSERPCYGWLSESEGEEEVQQQGAHALSPGGVCKRKRSD